MATEARPNVTDEMALRRLAERIANKPEKIDNGRLHAGSPMYFYCIICEHLSDVKPESYTTAPKKHCKECAELKQVTGLTDGTLLELAKDVKL